ncbi:MAG: copper homeostasis protein CutC [Capnocytophaga sp.]|nr:copper homeostasis protein CutC [Capnocytophaga sp.]
MTFEICASSFESAKNAALAGAQRIELCSELGVGGITPSYGLIQKVMNDLSIANCVLIRPRSGDFTYTDDEFDVMLRDIAFCKQLHCDGVVSGALNPDGTIDEEKTGKMVEASGGMDFIFHRAFDCTPDPKEALITLKKLGVKRILTSGKKKSAVEGLPLLEELNTLANGKITIMPGGGINTRSILKIREAGFHEIHFSATVFEKSKGSLPFSFLTEAFLDESVRPVSNVEQIKTIIKSVTP